MAAYGAAIGTSFAVGPLMGGALADRPGWRWIFLINVPIGLLAIVVTVRRVRESRDPDPRRTDLPGLGTLAAGLFLLVFALLRGRGDGWSSTRTVAELGGAAALILAFLIIEARSAAPVLPLGLLRIRRFAAAQIGTLALSASFFALYLYVTVLLQDMLGVAPLGTGLVYLPGTLLIFIFSGASAQLGAGAHSSWTMVEPGFLLASLGTGLRNPVLAALSLASVAATMSGLASGITNTARQAGIAVGIAGLGAFVPSHAIAHHSQPFVAGFRTAAWVAATLAILGALTSARLMRAPTVATPAERRPVPVSETA